LDKYLDIAKYKTEKPVAEDVLLSQALD